MSVDMKLTAAVERYGRKHTEDAEFFRSIAFAVDKNPEVILEHCHQPAITRLLSSSHNDCLERVIQMEALSYGDAGAMLAAPGPSLSGLVVREIGTPEQNEQYFTHVVNQRARTFLAVTEPNKGSDAGNMQTLLQKSENKWYLNGEKWLVGNGAQATIGVVMARTSNGPLGITAVLLMPDQLASTNNKSLFRTNLPMFALRGAQLSHMEFKNFSIKPENILGQHMKAVDRGMMAILKTFNRMRPCVGAQALGLAQAVLDYIANHRRHLKIQEEIKYTQLATRVHAARQILHHAAFAVDRNPLQGSLSSLAKMRATHTAEQVVMTSLDFFGAGALLEHPWLAKWYRDVWGFEYMEGTTDIQKKNIVQGYIHGALS